MKDRILATTRLSPRVASNRVSINLPYERAGQLRELANRHSIGMTELIERWIIRELQELGEKSTPPAGFMVEPMAVHKERVVLFQVDGLPVTALTPTEARALCEALFAAADQNKATVLPRIERGNRHVEVRRQGRGVVISIDGARRSMTPLIATDLATLLDNDATAAEELEDGVPLPRKAPTEGRARQLWDAMQKGTRN